MSSAGGSRGVQVPRLGTLIVLAAAIAAGGVAWLEMRAGRASRSEVEFSEADPIDRLRSIEALVEEDPDAVEKLISLATDTDARMRRDALFGLGRLGPDAAAALPQVRERLRDADPQVRSYALTALDRICEDRLEVSSAAVTQLADPDQGVRDGAGRYLRGASSSVLPAVLELAHSEHQATRDHVVRIIRRMDRRCEHPEVTAVLRELVNDPDAGVRIDAGRGLVDRGAANLADVRLWLAADDSATACLALEAIDSLGPEREELFPLLIERAQRPPSNWTPIRFGDFGQISNRDNAEYVYLMGLLRALARFGTAARPSVGALLEQIEALPARERSYYSYALLAIGADPDEVLRLVAPTQTNEDSRDNGWFAALLARCKPDQARERATSLIERQASNPLQIDAADLAELSELAAAVPAAVPLLAALLAHQDEQPRMRAVEGLENSGAAAGTAVPALLELLEREGPGSANGRRVIEALGKIGPAARAAAPRLAQLLEAPFETLDEGNAKWYDPRYAALRALGRIGNDAPEIVAAIRSQLARDESPRGPRNAGDDLCLESLKALIRLGGTALESSAVLGLLDDPMPSVRAQAAAVVPRFCADEATALDRLTRALGDEDPFVQSAAALALGELGRSAAPVAEQLRELARDGRNAGPNGRRAGSQMSETPGPRALGDEDPFVQSAAALSLGEVGRSAAPVVPQLREPARDGRNASPNWRRSGSQMSETLGLGDLDLRRLSVARAAAMALAKIDPVPK